MKKTDTIALYRDAYLAGRDEDDCRAFDEKDVARQYAAIMSWKRRQELASVAASRPAGQGSVASVIEAVRNACKTLQAMDELSARDSERLTEAVSQLRYELENFEGIRKGRRLRELRNRRIELDREIGLLESEGIEEC